MGASANVADLIDRQVDFLHRCRSVFPRLQKNMAGQKEFRAPDYYLQLGYNVSVQLSEPMTPEFIDGVFEIGHWLNENFIIRLWAILDANRIVSKTTKINRDLEGCVDVDLVRRLRNQIAHGSGIYDADDSEKKKLFETLVAHYDIPEVYSYLEVEKYPIGIGKVLTPMAEGCKKYAVALLEAK